MSDLSENEFDDVSQNGSNDESDLEQQIDEDLATPYEVDFSDAGTFVEIDGKLYQVPAAEGSGLGHFRFYNRIVNASSFNVDAEALIAHDASAWAKVEDLSPVFIVAARFVTVEGDLATRLMVLIENDDVVKKRTLVTLPTASVEAVFNMMRNHAEFSRSSLLKLDVNNETELDPVSSQLSLVRESTIPGRKVKSLNLFWTDTAAKAPKKPTKKEVKSAEAQAKRAEREAEKQAKVKAKAEAAAERQRLKDEAAAKKAADAAAKAAAKEKAAAERAAKPRSRSKKAPKPPPEAPTAPASPTFVAAPASPAAAPASPTATATAAPAAKKRKDVSASSSTTSTNDIDSVKKLKTTVTYNVSLAPGATNMIIPALNLGATHCRVCVEYDD